MFTNNLPDEILALPVEDRIQLAMSIWDSVEEESIQLSNEHQQLLEDRLREHEANPDEGESWEVVRARLWKDK